MLEFPTMMQVRMNLMNHENTPVEIIEVLRKAPKVALFSHVSPDGDCIGSMLAIGLALEKMDEDMATNLYTAILTDSGCFECSNTTAQTHRSVADLLDLGVDLSRIHNNIFDQKPLAQIKLLQCALNGLETV